MTFLVIVLKSDKLMTLLVIFATPTLSAFPGDRMSSVLVNLSAEIFRIPLWSHPLDGGTRGDCSYISQQVNDYDNVVVVVVVVDDDDDDDGDCVGRSFSRNRIWCISAI